MPPESTTWKLEPHTKGKHLVLEHYMQAWLPILGSRGGRILFIDGFAGPGEYENGEEGSPLIAMRALADHSAQRVIDAEVVFIFIEKKPDRVQHLQHLVEEWRPRLPEKATVHVIKDKFDHTMTEALDGLRVAGTGLAPAFVMIDPFGVEGFPMELIQRILANRSCEVYVTFMWESINRFISTPEFKKHLSALYGTEEWKKAITLHGKERFRFLYDLYEEQLREAGAKQVVHFDLYEGGRDDSSTPEDAGSDSCVLPNRPNWISDMTTHTPPVPAHTRTSASRDAPQRRASRLRQ